MKTRTNQQAQGWRCGPTRRRQTESGDQPRGATLEMRTNHEAWHGRDVR